MPFSPKKKKRTSAQSKYLFHNFLHVQEQRNLEVNVYWDYIMCCGLHSIYIPSIISLYHASSIYLFIIICVYLLYLSIYNCHLLIAFGIFKSGLALEPCLAWIVLYSQNSPGVCHNPPVSASPMLRLQVCSTIWAAIMICFDMGNGISYF